MEKSMFRGSVSLSSGLVLSIDKSSTCIPKKSTSNPKKSISERIQGSTYTTYEIQIWYPETDAKIIVKKRFRQFLALHNCLKQFFLEKYPLHFPVQKSLKKMDPQIIQQREHQLQQFLREIQTYPHLFESFFVRLFLGLIEAEGKTCIITGGSSGIGKETAKFLASMGMHVILACRSEENALKAIEEIKNSKDIYHSESSVNLSLEYLHLDLSSLKSVKEFVVKFKAKGIPLHLLILNAGVLGELGLTSDGFEMAFGVNYLGHFALSELLLETISFCAPSRIVVLGSEEHYNVKSIPYDKLKSPASLRTALDAYQVSKLACSFFTVELSKNLPPGVTVNCAMPGFVETNLFRRLPGVFEDVIRQFQTPIEEGILPVLYCAVSDEMSNLSGHFVGSTCHQKWPNKVTEDNILASTLWQLSESYVSDVLNEEKLGRKTLTFQPDAVREKLNITREEMELEWKTSNSQSNATKEPPKTEEILTEVIIQKEDFQTSEKNQIEIFSQDTFFNLEGHTELPDTKEQRKESTEISAPLGELTQSNSQTNKN